MCRDTNTGCWENRDELVEGLHAGGGQEGAELWKGTLLKGKIAACLKLWEGRLGFHWKSRKLEKELPSSAVRYYQEYWEEMPDRSQNLLKKAKLQLRSS